MLYAVCLIFEKWVPAYKKVPGILRHFITIMLVTLGFVLFNGEDMAQVGSDFACLFGFGKLPLISTETIYYLTSYAVLFVLGIVGCTPLVKNVAVRLAEGKKTGVIVAVLEGIVLILLLLICTGFLVDGSFSPFLYFRF